MLAELETQFSFTNSNEIPIIQSMGISSNQLCLFDGHTLNGSDGTAIDISNRIAIAMFNSFGEKTSFGLFGADKRPEFYPSYDINDIAIHLTSTSEKIYLTNNLSYFIVMQDADIQCAYHPSLSKTTALQEVKKPIVQAIPTLKFIGFNDICVIGHLSQKEEITNILKNKGVSLQCTIDFLSPELPTLENIEILNQSVSVELQNSVDLEKTDYSLSELKFVEGKIDLSLPCSRYDYACKALTYAMQQEKAVPAFNSIKHIYNAVNDQSRISGKTLNDIFNRVQRIVDNRKKVALQAVKVDSWGNHKVTVVDSLESAVIDHKINIITAPTASGKTKHTIKPFSDKAKSENKKFMAVAPLVSLISELSLKLDIGMYSDVKHENDTLSTDSLAVCLPSIKSFKLRSFVGGVSYLAIDEISQNLRFTASKECKVKGADSEAIYFELKKLVSECEQIVVADASIDNKTLRFFEGALPNTKFNIIQQKPKDTGRQCFIYQEMGDLIYRVLSEVTINNGNVWLAIESADRSANVGAYFEQQGLNVLVINSKNKGNKAQKQFLSNPEKYSKDYQIVIASPVISSGISIEHHDNPHFTLIAGIASGHRICPTDFMQMLARVRYIPDYHVCLLGNNERDNKITEKSFLSGYRLSAQLEGGNLVQNEYSEFKAICEAESIKYRADFANGFYWVMQHFMFNVSHVLDSNAYDFMKQEIKEIAQVRNAEELNFLMTADPITKEEAERLEIADKTEIESLQLQAYISRKLLGYPWDHQLSEIDVEMAQNVRRIVRFSRYKGLKPKKDDVDKNIALRAYDSAQIKAYRMVFGDTDISELRINEDIASEIIKRVVDNRFLLAGLRLVPQKYGRWDEVKSTLELKPYPITKKPTRALNEIFEMMGLTTARRTTTGGSKFLQITPDSWQRMSHYSKLQHDSFV